MKATITLSGIVAALSILVPGHSAAAVPPVLNFSGRLGTDVGDFTGAATLVGTIYDGPASQPLALALWTESQDVYVDQGRFHMLLGADPSNPLPVELVDAPELYIGIAVGDDDEMVPRMRLVSVPFALRSGDAGTLGGQGPGDFSTADHGHEFFEISGALGETQLPASVVLESELTAGLAGKADHAHAHDEAYVNEGQSGSVDGAMVLDRSLTLVDLGDSGCGDQQVAKWDLGSQTWICADDGDTDTDTTYTAGAGLTLAGTEFSVDQIMVEGWARAVCYDTPDELTAVLGAVYAPLGHTHDDSYYTEAETDALLLTFAPTVHNHDSLYYGKTAVDTALAGKTDVGHHHDDLYFRESEVTSALEGKSDVGHSHNGLYYTEGEVDALLGGYLTSYTETDPTFQASTAYGIAGNDITNWNTAHGWGDHSTAGYLSAYSETDPTFQTSAAYGIAGNDITNWNTAHGWGDHSTAGYLSAYSETDPTFQASTAYGIAGNDITNWNTAHGWGDHSTAGYLSAYTETDPTFQASTAYGIAGNDITNWNTAYTDRMKWDGGSTGLNAVTGRTSLGLGSLAVLSAVSGGTGGTITDGTITFDDLGANGCTNGQVMQYDGPNNEWDCATISLSNAGTLDSLDSTQFLRSDASDTYSSGTLSFAPGTAVDVEGSLDLPTTGITGAGTGSGLDADLLDGQHATAFAAADHHHDGDYAAFAPIQVPQSTTINIVDANTGTGYYSAITIGADGLPFIAYLDVGNYDLKVVKCGNPSCSSGNLITVVDPGMGDTNLSKVSVAIGSDGLPVIVYYSGDSFYQPYINDAIRVAKCTNANCSSFTILDVDTGADENPSIAIGIDGFPILSYDYGNLTRTLRVTKCGSHDCSTVSATTDVGTGGWFSSIAIGLDGLPVVATMVNTSDYIRFYKCGNAACSSGNTYQTVDSSVNTRMYAEGLTIGNDGLPIMAYYDVTNNDLRVAHCTATDCSTLDAPTAVDSTGNTGKLPGITIAPDGLPVIVHHEYEYIAPNSFYDVSVAKCSNPACSSATVVDIETDMSKGGSTSITIGADGYPVISYYGDDGAGNGVLKVAKCANPFCLSGWSRR